MWWIIGYLVGSLLAAQSTRAAAIVGSRTDEQMEDDYE